MQRYRRVVVLRHARIGPLRFLGAVLERSHLFAVSEITEIAATWF